MKLNRTQLRQIVRETMNRLDEAPEESIDVAGEFGECLGRSLLFVFNEYFDDVVRGAWDQVLEVHGEDQMPVPGRVEDIDHWATKIADVVLKNPRLHDTLTDAASRLLRSSLDAPGSPGPGST